MQNSSRLGPLSRGLDLEHWAVTKCGVPGTQLTLIGSIIAMRWSLHVRAVIPPHCTIQDVHTKTVPSCTHRSLEIPLVKQRADDGRELYRTLGPELPSYSSPRPPQPHHGDNLGLSRVLSLTNLAAHVAMPIQPRSMAELDCVPTIWIATCRLTNHGRHTRRRLGEPLLQKLGHSTIIIGLWNGYLTRPFFSTCLPHRANLPWHQTPSPIIPLRKRCFSPEISARRPPPGKRGEPI